jgi:hypothetical protein
LAGSEWLTRFDSLTGRSDSRRKASSVTSGMTPYANSPQSTIQSPRINERGNHSPVKHTRSLVWNPALNLRFEVPERSRYERRDMSDFSARRFADDGMVLPSSLRLDWTRKSRWGASLTPAAPMSDLAAFSLSATTDRKRVSSSSSNTTPDSRIMSPFGVTASSSASTSHRSESPYGPLPSISHLNIGPGDDGIPTLPHLANILSPNVVDSVRTLPRIRPRGNEPEPDRIGYLGR